MIKYKGIDDTRNGYITLENNNVIIKFTNKKYIWGNFKPRKLLPIIKNDCEMYELNLKDLHRIELTRELLDEVFGSQHIPEFSFNFFAKLVENRINQKCQTLVMIKDDYAISTIGYEFRSYDVKGEKALLKTPFLSDAATRLAYRKHGFLTLLHLVAFSRAIEDDVCIFEDNKYLFYAPTSVKSSKVEVFLNYDEFSLSKLSSSFKAIISMRNIDGIDEILFERFMKSSHLPGYTNILMSLYLNPKVEVA